jgi:hypothetical protein
MKKDPSILSTKPEDEKFHRSRIMFLIIGQEVRVGTTGTKESHLEWFKREGWLSEETADRFMDEHVRGFYLPSEDSFYCYNGWGFFFDAKVVNEVIEKLSLLKKALNLNDETRICFGPKDNPIGGYTYQQYFAGKIKDLLPPLFP